VQRARPQRGQAEGEGRREGAHRVQGLLERPCLLPACTGGQPLANHNELLKEEAGRGTGASKGPGLKAQTVLGSAKEKA